MNKGYKSNNGISKAQVVELILAEVAKIQTGGLDLSTYAKKSEVSTQISNAIKNFLTEEEVQALLEALDIPTKISELQNDLNLANKTYVDNAIEAKKHYTEEEIKTIIEGVLDEKEITGTVDEEAVQLIVNTSLSQLNIPTKTSQLTNDSGFVTGTEVDTKIANAGTVNEEAVQSIVDTSLSQLNIPTKTSQLANDSNFITGSEVDSKIANASLGGEVDLTSYAKKTELADKVDKVEGKSLISDTEIQRLATLKNYDDSAIKTSLSNKVDKVSGKSLISDTEIQRLAKLNNYDDTEIKTSLSNKVDKVEGKSLVEDSVIEATKVLINEEKLEYIVKIDSSLSSVELTKSIQQQFDEAYELGYRRVTFPKNTEIEVIDELDGVCPLGSGSKEKAILILKSNTIYDLNGSVIKLKTNNYAGCQIINFELIEDTVLKNGEIIGDLDSHIYSTYSSSGLNTHEYGAGIFLKGCKRCRCENVKISKIVGDGVSFGMCLNLGRDVVLQESQLEKGDISSQGEPVEGEGYRMKDYIVVQNLLDQDGVFSRDNSFIIMPSNPTGYGQEGSYERSDLNISFYSKDNEFISCATVDVCTPLILPKQGDKIKLSFPYQEFENYSDKKVLLTFGELTENSFVEDCKIFECRRQGVTISGSRMSGVKNCHIKEIKGASPQSCIDVEDTGLISKNIFIENIIMENSFAGIILYDGSGHIVNNCIFRDINYPFSGQYSQYWNISNCLIEYRKTEKSVFDATQATTPTINLPENSLITNIRIKNMDTVRLGKGNKVNGIVLEDCRTFDFKHSNIDNCTIKLKYISGTSRVSTIENCNINNCIIEGNYGIVNFKDNTVNKLITQSGTMIKTSSCSFCDSEISQFILFGRVGSIERDTFLNCKLGNSEVIPCLGDGGAYEKYSKIIFSNCTLVSGKRWGDGMIPLHSNLEIVIDNCIIKDYATRHLFTTSDTYNGKAIVKNSVVINEIGNVVGGYKIIRDYNPNGRVELIENEFVNIPQPDVNLVNLIDEDNIWR